MSVELCGVQKCVLEVCVEWCFVHVHVCVEWYGVQKPVKICVEWGDVHKRVQEVCVE